MAESPSLFDLMLLYEKLDKDYKRLIAKQGKTLELLPLKQYKIQDLFWRRINIGLVMSGENDLTVH